MLFIIHKNGIHLELCRSLSMTTERSAVVKIKKYELVPPDGGWGYMICLSATVIMSCLMMFMGCFGLIFNEFFKELKMDSTSISVLWGLCTFCLAVSGFLTGPLLRIMSLRQLAFVAAVLFNLGIFGTIFVNNKPMFFLCQGFLQYSGIGILFNVTYTFLNGYFLKKRFLAMNLVQATAALATMLAPLLVKWTLAELGFRGTLIVISAVSMQVFVAVALFQPVEWHMKKVEVMTAEEMLLLSVNEENPQQKEDSTPGTDATPEDIEKSLDPKLDMRTEEFERSGLGDEDKKTLIEKINEVVDLGLLKKLCISSAAMGMSLCVFGDGVFCIMLPQALYAVGWTDDKVALALFLLCLGDLVTRIVSIFLSKWMAKLGSQWLFIIGLVIAVLTRLGMLWSANVTAMLVFITIMGVGRYTTLVLPGLVLVEVFDPRKFTSVFGMYMMIYGFNNIVFGPAIGAIRDLTNSYPIAFYVITSIFGAVAVLWTIELRLSPNGKRKQKINSCK